MKHKVKLNLERLNDPGLISKGKVVVSSMTNNQFYPEPYPAYVASLSKINDTIAVFEQAYLDGLSGEKQKIALRKKIRAELIDQLKDLARYVELVAKGDLQMLTSTGFDISKPAAAGSVKADHGQVTDMRISRGGKRGMVVVKAKRVRGAASYQIHMTTGDPTVEANWMEGGVFAHCTNMEMAGLNLGLQHYFRMRCIMSEGPGPWSNPFPFMPT